MVPTGRTSMLSIQFYPHSIALFFDLPINELTNETLDTSAINGRQAHELEEQLHDLPSLDDKVKHIEKFLLRRLNRKQEYTWKRVCHNIQLINQHNGMITPDQLASEACLSRKQHERIFRQMVGLSPKQFFKVIRFQYAIYAHQQYPFESLTEIAYRCGYYDQSHMINDFHELSGITPRQYFSTCETPNSDYFLAINYFIQRKFQVTKHTKKRSFPSRNDLLYSKRNLTFRKRQISIFKLCFRSFFGSRSNFSSRCFSFCFFSSFGSRFSSSFNHLIFQIGQRLDIT